MVFCLDNNTINYDTLSVNTSLRGNYKAVLKVSVLEEGIHSEASGIVPESFRAIRALLNRLEDHKTGKVILQDLYTEIPDTYLDYAKKLVEVTGDQTTKEVPFLDGVQPIVDDPLEAYLNKIFRPVLSVTGADGFPPCQVGGNVLRPYSSLTFTIRLPPNLDPEIAKKSIATTLLADPPFGVKVELLEVAAKSGFLAPPLSENLLTSLNEITGEIFDQEPLFAATGGTIPFLYDLG